MPLWRKPEEKEKPEPRKGKRRKLESYDLGQRFSIEEKLCHDVFRVEEEITKRIEEVLAKGDYGAVGAYLKEFYLKICELIDEAKSELVKTTP